MTLLLSLQRTSGAIAERWDALRGHLVRRGATQAQASASAGPIGGAVPIGLDRQAFELGPSERPLASVGRQRDPHHRLPGIHGPRTARANELTREQMHAADVPLPTARRLDPDA